MNEDYEMRMKDGEGTGRRLDLHMICVKVPGNKRGGFPRFHG
jgi:hypothetical protein